MLPPALSAKAGRHRQADRASNNVATVRTFAFPENPTPAPITPQLGHSQPFARRPVDNCKYKEFDAYFTADYDEEIGSTAAIASREWIGREDRAGFGGCGQCGDRRTPHKLTAEHGQYRRCKPGSPLVLDTSSLVSPSRRSEPTRCVPACRPAMIRLHFGAAVRSY